MLTAEDQADLMALRARCTQRCNQGRQCTCAPARMWQDEVRHPWLIVGYAVAACVAAALAVRYPWAWFQ